MGIGASIDNFQSGSGSGSRSGSGSAPIVGAAPIMCGIGTYCPQGSPAPVVCGAGTTCDRPGMTAPCQFVVSTVSLIEYAVNWDGTLTGSPKNVYKSFCMAIDSLGNVYTLLFGFYTSIERNLGGRIRKTTPAGISTYLNLVSENGAAFKIEYVNRKYSMAIDSLGNIYFAGFAMSARLDDQWWNADGGPVGAVYKFTPNGSGSGSRAGSGSGSRSGLETYTVSTVVTARSIGGSISGIGFDSTGAFYYGDFGNYAASPGPGIYRIVSGVRSRFLAAGDGIQDELEGSSFVFDPLGNMYVRDITYTGNYINFIIYKITPAGVKTTVYNYAYLNNPSLDYQELRSIAVDSRGNIYSITQMDYGYTRINKISGGVSTVFLGGGPAGGGGKISGSSITGIQYTDGPVFQATVGMGRTQGTAVVNLAIGPSDTLYIGETLEYPIQPGWVLLENKNFLVNNTIRKVQPDGC